MYNKGHGHFHLLVRLRSISVYRKLLIMIVALAIFYGVVC